MKKNLFIMRFILALVVVTLMGLTTRTWAAGTFPTNTYTQSFLIGSNTAPFAGSGSVASWINWYDTPGNNTQMTNDVNTPDPLAGAGAGSLMVDNPFTNANQNLFFGTFGNQSGYDWSTQVDLAKFDTINFDVYVKPVNPNTGLIQQTDSSNDFGGLEVGVITPTPAVAATFFGTVTIPASASNGWVHLSMPINHALGDLSHIGGIAFNYNNYNGYPTNDLVFWLGHLTMHYNPALSNAPPTLMSFQKPVVGLNLTDTQVTGNPNDRYQVETANSTGYSFANHPSGTVTYSWNIKSFPTNSPNAYQQHFFIVNGTPGLYDQAADYNLADCIFITVQVDTNGFGYMQFRYKTNNPTSVLMIYNTATNNTYSWPVQPVCSLPTTNSPLGTWSVAFNNQTNVTLTSPRGQTTNFVLDPASAALFADPATPILGAQPNDANALGEAVVYNSFSITGNDSPFTDIFTNDSQLNTNYWKVLANDPNGVVLVPPNAVYWLPWTLPDTGFSLQTNANLALTSNWNEVVVLSQIQNNATNRAALLGTSSLPSASQGYFRLLKRTATQLQVLWPGQTNAPGAPGGYTGTPAPESAFNGYNGLGFTPVTINAVDSNFHIVNSSDMVYLTNSPSGSDTTAIYNPGAPLTNGTVQIDMVWGNPSGGTWTVSAADVTSTNIPLATSTTVTVGP